MSSFPISLRSRGVSFAVVAALLILRTGLTAQQVTLQEEAEAPFAAALAAYDRGDYRGAELGFAECARKFPTSQRVTAALIMRAKALFQLNESYEASKAVKAFLAAYPSSRYVPDAELLLGRVYDHIERFDEAREAGLRAFRALGPDSPTRLQEEVRALLDTVFDAHTQIPGLYAALEKAPSEAMRGYFWAKIAERELDRGNVAGATAAVDSMTTRYPATVTHDRLSTLRLRLGGVASVKIGILLPLLRNDPSPAGREAGNEVYDGILTAYDRLVGGERSTIRATLEVRDTQRDPQIAAAMAKELAADKSIIGILGPVFSPTTMAAARVAAAEKIPLVTPTANQNGIAAIGPVVFQTNPDYEQRGRAMARYAVEKLGAGVVAVLAPSDTYARFLADAFAQEATALGATVATKEWYQKGTSDLRTQLAGIRRAGLRVSSEPVLAFGGRMPRAEVAKLVRLGVPAARVDSLLQRGATVPVRWLLGANGKDRLDSIGVKVSFDETLVDSLQIKVGGIQALYCPISSPEEIGMVASQLVYQNIGAQILGSGEWNSVADLEANRRYCLGIRFESDNAIDTTTTAYKDFLAAFTARFKKRPGKNTLYGYDAAALMFSVVAGGASTRESLTRALASVQQYAGVKGRIGFTPGRVNTWVNVLEYTEQGITRVGEVSGMP